MNYAIIGFGSAGYHALRSIYQYDLHPNIMIYSNSEYAPYNPMLTTYYADSKINFNALFPFGSIEEIQTLYPFTLIKEEVIKVTKQKEVITSNHKKQYDRILIATGSTSFLPAIPGLKNEKTISMRNIDDAIKLSNIVKDPSIKKAIVVGASMTGIKVAEVLSHANIQVTMIDLSSHIFPIQCYEDVAKQIEKDLQKDSLQFYWHTSIDHVDENIAILSNGKEIEYDLVALCIGTRSNINMIKDIVNSNRGILVDDHMQTSIPGIFAAGDVAEAKNVQTNQNALNGLWANAAIQGECAGMNMVNMIKRYDGSMFQNITHFFNHDFIGFGDIHASGTPLYYGSLENGFFIRLMIQDHRIVSGNIYHNYAISGIFANYIYNLFLNKGKPLTPLQKAMLSNYQVPTYWIEELEEMIYGSRS